MFVQYIFYINTSVNSKIGNENEAFEKNLGKIAQCKLPKKSANNSLRPSDACVAMKLTLG